MKADKTKNMYRMPRKTYQKILHDNITRKLQSYNRGSVYEKVNMEAKELAKELKIDNRMDIMAKADEFITLKDHKPRFDV